jgi:two-component system sensor histidine kinase KdpD
VEQAIGNVVANAIVHTPKETHIGIDAVIGDSEIVLRVTDDGPGVAMEAQPHIFDKFARAPAGPADGGESTGLGLAIAKGIMEAHGGSIQVESPAANGRGARFILVFPREAP